MSCCQIAKKYSALQREGAASLVLQMGESISDHIEQWFGFSAHGRACAGVVFGKREKGGWINIALLVIIYCVFYPPEAMKSTIRRAIVTFQEKGGILRTCEAMEAGIHPRTLYALRDDGAIKQTGRGLFRLASLPPLSEPDLVVVAKRVPAAVVCLISALAIHELTTQIPHAVQIAVLPGAHTPRISHPPTAVFRFSQETFTAGVEERLIDGIAVRVFSPEKTLADVFKFRNRLGLEIAVESLRNYARKKRRRMDLVLDFARVCRVEKLIRPYLEALA
jgi:hypothetical protein